MPSKLRFDGKVVLITGGGGSLGRSYALEFGKRGAFIVVNDLGVSVTGTGTSTKVADSVVQELKSIGIKAIANYDSVEHGDRVIKSVIDEFGKIDIIINNAGILKEVPMTNITDEDWDNTIKVHLKGSFKVCKAAWKHMMENKYGRIINTSSGSGIYGYFGHASYSAAKLGLHGLTQTISKEGEKYNIRANTIVPVAVSRISQDTFAPDLLDILVPEKIVPLVVYLCHSSCTETGGIYEIAGGWVTKLRWERAEGFFSNEKYTAEDIKKEWKRVINFEGRNDYPTSVSDTIEKVCKLFDDDHRPRI